MYGQRAQTMKSCLSGSVAGKAFGSGISMYNPPSGCASTRLSPSLKIALDLELACRNG